MIDKVRPDLLAVVDAIPDGACVGIGGFGNSGRPDELIDALCETDKRELHIVANNVGDDPTGIARLADEGRIRKFTGSFPIWPAFYERYFGGGVELELIPQGTLAERLRAGGAGIPAFYTPAAAGTLLTSGEFVQKYGPDGIAEEYSHVREVREFDGRPYVLEQAIVPQFGLVRAHVADPRGNLRFRLSARNFNPLVAMAARHTIVQVKHVVELGSIEPDDVHLAGVFVDEVVHVPTQGDRRAAA